MLASIISLLAAAAYGVGDFFGAIATRRTHPIWVSFIGHIFYAAIALLGLLIFQGSWSSGASIWGIATGASEAIGFLVFYFALSIGNISLVAPLVSVIYASVPVLWGIAQGDELSPTQLLGLALGLFAVLALSIEPTAKGDSAKRPLFQVLSLSLAGGIMWGFSTVALSYAPSDSGMVPILVSGLTAFALLSITVMATRSRSLPELNRAALAPSIWSGALFGVANLLIVSALRLGSLALVGLLTALYPLATVFLARLVFKEKISILRWLGIVLAISAAALLSLAS